MESLSWMFKLTDGISGPAGKMMKGLKGFASTLLSGGSALKGMGDKASDFAGEAMVAVDAAEAIAGAVLAVAQGAFAFGKLVIDAADFKRQTLAALTIIEGTSGAANDALKTLQTMANHAGVDTGELIAQYKDLRAAGLSAKDAQNVIASGLDVGAVFGKGAGDAVTKGINDIKTLGKFNPKSVKSILKSANLPADELRKTLAKMKGVTVQQVDAMMAAGKISADEGITAILTTIQNKVDNGGPLGSATKNLIGDTVGGQLQTLKNQLSDLFGDSTLGAPIKDALKTINGLLSANSATGKKLRKILGGALQFITRALKSLLTADNISAVFNAIIGVAQTLRNVFNTLLPYLKALGGPLWHAIKAAVGPVLAYFKELFSGKSTANPKLLAGLKDLGRVLGWIVGIVLDVVGIVAVLAAGLTALCYVVAAGVVEAIQDVGDFLSGAASSISDFVSEIVDSVGSLYDDAVDAAGNFIDGLIQGIEDGWDTVVAKVGGLGDAVITTVEDKLGIHSPSKVMAQMGMFTALGFAKGVNDNAGVVSGAMGDMTGAPFGQLPSQSPSNASSNGAPASVSIGDIVVHVPEGTKDPQAFGRAVGTEVRAQVLAIFEELGLQIGAIAA